MSSSPSTHAEIVVDLAVVRHNVRTLRRLVATGLANSCEVMVVVKADACGHGMLPCARACLAQRGRRGPDAELVGVPGQNYVQAINQDIDVTAYPLNQFAESVKFAFRRT